ncbi:MAG TPA: glutamate cyclase domain-containing protein [Pirellulales bacterium]
MSSAQRLAWPSLEALVRRDPARRGVASFTVAGSPLCAGQLMVAAQELAARATAVGIVTGFCISGASPPAAETDGPPGALLLARTLNLLGIEVALIADRYATPLLEVGCDFLGLPRSIVRDFPLEEIAPAAASNATTITPQADRWSEDFLRSDLGSRLSHLISIEHVGPSHTERSFLAQKRNAPPPLANFESAVPTASRDVCHNMRGSPIDAWTGRAHRLFELIAEFHPHITTIGIGDGGNEIGMGTIPWETLRQAIIVGPGGLVPCRVATDYTLLAGVSDWAAYALALAMIPLRGAEIPTAWDESCLRELIERLVRDAGAVDGVTGRPEATVDGLPLETYLQVFSGIRELCAAAAR